MERLQKVIAKAGVASRRNAEKLIEEGRVKVNGKVVKEMGVQVDGNDEILVDNKPIKFEEKVYYLFNKPKKVITTVTDNHKRKTVLDYFPDVNERIYPVGRLDYETTGLLILTNDGEFAHKMMHPRGHIEKTYQVTVEGIFTDKMAIILTNGILIDGKKTLPAIIEIVSRSKSKNQTVLNITIFEGRNREIRKMMEYFHCKVTALDRIAYGNLELGNIQRGKYRKLRNYEIKKLIALANQESISDDMTSSSGSM